MKKEIRDWNKNHNENTLNRLVDVEIALANAEVGDWDELSIWKFKMDIEEISMIKDNMLHQKARINWLREGDRNSSFS